MSREIWETAHAGIPFFTIRGFAGFFFDDGKIYVVDYGPEDVRESDAPGNVVVTCTIPDNMDADGIWALGNNLMFAYEYVVYPERDPDHA